VWRICSFLSPFLYIILTRKIENGIRLMNFQNHQRRINKMQAAINHASALNFKFLGVADGERAVHKEAILKNNLLKGAFSVIAISEGAVLIR
jgi:hypothetical protein